jgi:hypothetical protein
MFMSSGSAWTAQLISASLSPSATVCPRQAAFKAPENHSTDAQVSPLRDVASRCARLTQARRLDAYLPDLVSPSWPSRSSHDLAARGQFRENVNFGGRCGLDWPICMGRGPLQANQDPCLHRKCASGDGVSRGASRNLHRRQIIILWRQGF